MKQPAVFLDRDGTIIRHVELLVDLKKVKLLPGAADAIRQLNRLGYLVVIITNQPVIARGLITPAGVDKMNMAIVRRLEKFDATIHGTFYCPHHPNANVKKYRMVCSCRKPAPGLLLQAMKRFDIDPKKSFMVGDAMIDILAGARAGVRTIMVKTGPGHQRDAELAAEAKPDFIVKDILAAARLVGRLRKRK
ncbi:MAG TPA: HAD family hydrolase [Candidatus Paceibacterota bacterium]|nr:HAD family hydrolase [Candidatus Paceibacterota bacterium]